MIGSLENIEGRSNEREAGEEIDELIRSNKERVDIVSYQELKVGAFSRFGRRFLQRQNLVLIFVHKLEDTKKNSKLFFRIYIRGLRPENISISNVMIVLIT